MQHVKQISTWVGLGLKHASKVQYQGTVSHVIVSAEAVVACLEESIYQEEFTWPSFRTWGKCVAPRYQSIGQHTLLVEGQTIRKRQSEASTNVSACRQAKK